MPPPTSGAGVPNLAGGLGGNPGQGMAQGGRLGQPGMPPGGQGAGQARGPWPQAPPPGLGGMGGQGAPMGGLGTSSAMTGLGRVAASGAMTGLGRLPLGASAGREAAGFELSGQQRQGLGSGRPAGDAPGGALADPAMAMSLLGKGGSQPGALGGLPRGAPGVLGAGGAAPQFDASEFPTLGADANDARGGGLGGLGMGGDYAAMAMQSLQGAKSPAPDFTESDFPALPGSLPGGSEGSQQQPDLGGARMSQAPRTGAAMGAMGQRLGGEPTAAAAAPQSNWGQVSRQGMPQGMTAEKMKAGMGPAGKGTRQADLSHQDRYGMAGLLSLIQMTDPDLATLALGMDLTTLGLNLNSGGPLHSTFASPWADAPLKIEEDFLSPHCFLGLSPPKLAPGSLHKFRTETLLFVFYSTPGEESQLLAADELSHRGWAFHKTQQMWLKRAPGTDPASTSDQEERGTFVLFDPKSWKEVTRADLVVRYADLERPPNLPRKQRASGGGHEGVAAKA